MVVKADGPGGKVMWDKSLRQQATDGAQPAQPVKKGPGGKYSVYPNVKKVFIAKERGQTRDTQAGGRGCKTCKKHYSFFCVCAAISYSSRRCR
jgi:hypothetical protein